MKAKELFKNLALWTSETITKNRLDSADISYDWVHRDIEFDEELTLANYRNFFSREKLNSEYAKRYKVENPSEKKPYRWYQTEINLIYSFHKCFAMRNHTRLQHYRNDMSQKGKRTFYSLNATIGKFEYLKSNEEEKQ